MLSPLSFAASQPLSIYPPPVAATRRRLLCTLEGSPPRTTDPTVAAKTLTEKAALASGKTFRVLDPDMPAEQLPPPPPVYRSLPKMGILFENKFGLSTPASRAARYGGIYTSDFFVNRMHFVTDADAIYELVQNPALFGSKGSSEAMEDAFGSDAMLHKDGPEHEAARAVWAPVFSRKIFPLYFAVLQEKIDAGWARMADATAAGERVLIDPAVRQMYLSAIVKLSTGIEMEADEASELRENFQTFQNLMFLKGVPVLYGRGQRAKKTILRILEEVIEDYLASRADVIEKLRAYGDNVPEAVKGMAGGEFNVMLLFIAHSPLKTGHGAPRDPVWFSRIAEWMVGFWFAAFGTASVTTISSCFELGMDARIANMLAAEQDALVVDAGGEHKISFEQAMGGMPLLQSYTTEILRLRPVAFGVFRRARQDTEVLGHMVKDGDILYQDFQAAMTDAGRFPDPFVLRPDRFLPRTGQAPPPRIFTFGVPGSPHYCLGAALAGLMMNCALGTLLRHYTLELDPRQSRDYKTLPEIVPKSQVVVNRLKRRCA